MFQRLREDIACILERDPAARSAWEVLTCYPGLHALLLHRRARWCHVHGLHWLARFVSHLGRFFTGIEIHPGAKIGRRVFMAYGITQGDDPLAHAMKGLIDNASGQEHQIALLWQAIEKLSARSRELPTPDCVPDDAHTTEQFDAEHFNRLVK